MSEFKRKNIVSLIFKFIVISMFSLMLSSCTTFLNVDDPVNLVWDKAERKSDRLIVFLPGLYDEAERFEEEDFFKMAREAGVEADMLAASIHVQHFIQGKMIEHIEKDIFQLIQNKGYKHIWFVGVSLGGLNALEYFRTHEKDLCGVVLLAPYILNKKLISEIESMDTGKVWQPKLGKDNVIAEERVQKLWLWLKNKADKSQIYMGYGDKDIYVSSHKVIANYLHENNVIKVKGKHSWKTGKKIWRQQLLSRKETGLLQPCP